MVSNGIACGNYYGYNYLQEPNNELVCLICLDVAKDPLQHDACGKLFCMECLEKLKHDCCPNCRRKVPVYYQDNRSKRNVLALPVMCSNASRKCEWEGTASMVEEHLSVCEFTLVPCSKQCRDDKDKINHIMRKDLDEHVKNACPNRDYECEHCGEKDTYFNITQVHDNKCEKKVLSCPNAECVEVLERQAMKRHVEVCTYAEFPCKYRRLGCNAKMRRNDILAHEEEDKFHFFVALDKMIVMDADMHKSKATTTTFELTGFSSRSMPFYSPTFNTSLEGYCMHIEVALYGQLLSVSAILVEGRHDKKLNWPFVGTVTVTLLNQLEDKDHFSIDINVTKEHQIFLEDEMPLFILSSSELTHNPVKNTQYLKDDTLHFRVLVEVADHKPWLECK